MKRSHYGGQLAGDEDDGNVEFYTGEGGQSSLRALPKMSASTPNLGHPEEDDDSLSQPFGHRKSKFSAEQRQSIAQIRADARKAGYRKQTLQLKKLRETERRYYKDAAGSHSVAGKLQTLDEGVKRNR